MDSGKTIERLYTRGVEINDLQEKYNKLTSSHNTEIEEKDNEIKNLSSEKSELRKGFQDVWGIVKQHPKYELFRGKGAELSLIVTGIIVELGKDLNEKNRQLNCKKSTIARRYNRIKNLLNKKKTKGTK